MGMIENLRSRRHEVWQQMSTLADRATTENRAFSGDEQERWNALRAELDRFDERIGSVVESGQRSKDADEAMERLAGGADPFRPERRTWLPSRNEYRSWFEERAVDSGGAFIPTQYAQSYWDHLRARSVVLAADPVVLPVAHAGSLKVPKVTASVTVSGVAENTPITASDPTLDAVTLDPRKFAGLVLASNESLADSQPNLRQVLANDLMRQTATVVDAQMLTGDGTGDNLLGLVGTVGATAADLGTGVSLDGCATMLGELEDANADRPNAVYFMSPTDWSTLRTEKASTAGTYQLQPDVTATEVRSLFGVTVATTTNMPAGTILLADMGQVVVGRSQDVTVQMSEHYAFNADQTALRVTARFDIGVMNPAAVVVGTLSA